MFVHGKNLTFGIEIECHIPTNRYTHGQLRFRKRSFTLDGISGWKIGTDSSLSHINGHHSIEICSPPLSGIDGLSQVVTVLDYLNSINTIVSQSCGIHIHVDGKHLERANLDGLINSFLRYEDLFFSTNGTQSQQRFSSSFCKPFNPRHPGDRYQSLNISNVHRNPTKNTVEFRLFKSTLDPETVFTWLYMCVGLVSRATKTTRPVRVPRNVTTFEKIESFVSQVFSKKTYQIDPDYAPDKNDSLYQVLFNEVPLSTI